LRLSHSLQSPKSLLSPLCLPISQGHQSLCDH
jgi:hypothetical protein